MATVHVTLSRVEARGDTGEAIAVPTSVPVAAETLTSSPTSQAGTKTATKNSGLFWTVVARGGDVWVAFGASPVAGPGLGFLVLQGWERAFSVTSVGEKIAIKDV